MTIADLKAYYANLLIIQYKSKPRANATIQATAEPFFMDNVAFDVQNGFDVDTAVGVQLDVIGKYVGVSRTGVSFSGNVTLSDSDFRLIVKLAIIENGSNGSLSDIQDLLFNFLPGTLFVFDFLDMRMGYYLDSSSVSLNLAQFIVAQNLLPKPMAVQLSSLLYVPITKMFFGFRKYFVPPHNIFPFNTYGAFHTNWPWLNYTNVINLMLPTFMTMETESDDTIVLEDGGTLFLN